MDSDPGRRGHDDGTGAQRVAQPFGYPLPLKLGDVQPGPAVPGPAVPEQDAAGGLERLAQASKTSIIGRCRWYWGRVGRQRPEAPDRRRPAGVERHARVDGD
ncbi:MAG: hypothetical protein ACRDOB_03295 [Streptosporangiaceae bacterium]